MYLKHPYESLEFVMLVHVYICIIFLDHVDRLMQCLGNQDFQHPDCILCDLIKVVFNGPIYKGMGKI